jgi:hypothetical protein
VAWDRDLDKLMVDRALDGQEGRAFVTERLNGLAKRRSELERGLVEIGQALSTVQREAVSAEVVTAGLTEFRDVYECLKPFERKELMYLVLHRAEVNDRQIVLEINGNVPALLAETPQKSEPRLGTPNWLHELVSRSV